MCVCVCMHVHVRVLVCVGVKDLFFSFHNSMTPLRPQTEASGVWEPSLMEEDTLVRNTGNALKEAGSLPSG